MIAGCFINIPAQTTLKDAYKKHFMIGAALNSAQFTETDKRGAEIVKKQFNTITPENVLKWGLVHPDPDRYDFAAPDKYVEFGVKNKMFIVGHTLVWHNQTPKWVFEDAQGKPLTREALLERLRDHIHTVVGRYKGKIRGWDVVNEALNEDGTMRQTQWYKIIGEDYLAKAFQYAHEADPKAELYYNDYSLENEPKRNGAVALLKKLLAQKIPVKAVGLQGHNRMTWPTLGQQDTTIAAFAALGIKVMITELDVEMLPRDTGNQAADVNLDIKLNKTLNPYVDGLPESLQQEQAKRYADLFAIYLKHKRSVTRVTFWGVTDGDSWLNGWPVRGRTNHPLLFDREGKPKPAFDAVIKAGQNRER
jgi:endo-1,4-beta-xylanase